MIHFTSLAMRVHTKSKQALLSDYPSSQDQLISAYSSALSQTQQATVAPTVLDLVSGNHFLASTILLKLSSLSAENDRLLQRLRHEKQVNQEQADELWAVKKESHQDRLELIGLREKEAELAEAVKERTRMIRELKEENSELLSKHSKREDSNILDRSPSVVRSNGRSTSAKRPRGDSEEERYEQYDAVPESPEAFRPPSTSTRRRRDSDSTSIANTDLESRSSSKRHRGQEEKEGAGGHSSHRSSRHREPESGRDRDRKRERSKDRSERRRSRSPRRESSRADKAESSKSSGHRHRSASRERKSRDGDARADERRESGRSRRRHGSRSRSPSRHEDRHSSRHHPDSEDDHRRQDTKDIQPSIPTGPRRRTSVREEQELAAPTRRDSTRSHAEDSLSPEIDLGTGLEDAYDTRESSPPTVKSHSILGAAGRKAEPPAATPSAPAASRRNGQNGERKMSGSNLMGRLGLPVGPSSRGANGPSGRGGSGRKR